MANLALQFSAANHGARVARMVHSTTCVTATSPRRVMAAVALLAARSATARICAIVRQLSTNKQHWYWLLFFCEVRLMQRWSAIAGQGPLALEWHQGFLLLLLIVQLLFSVQLLLDAPSELSC